MVPRGYRRFPVVTVALLLPIAASCDSSVRVGEVREVPAEPIADGGPLVPPPDAATLPESWKQHAPLVPCSIYAIAEARNGDVWIGCNGGRIYRYDGVHARLAYGGDEKSIVSLLWVAADGQVWAGAQTGRGVTATTSLHRFDGTTWHDVAGPKERVTSITGDPGTLWLTTDAKILRLTASGTFETSFTSPGGTFRSCAFADTTHGFCVGTAGLALAWDGTGWSPVAAPPWSAKAEVFGVEIEPIYKTTTTFLYGEPITSTSGDQRCTAARLTPTTFAALTAGKPCFTDFDVARKRTGIVSVGLRDYPLLSPEATYGGALVFDPGADTVSSLCGPVLTFSGALTNTRVGGVAGLLATIVGSGGSQLALTGARGSNTSFEELAVAADGTAWARVEDVTACGSVSDTLVRFEADATWGPVVGPPAAQSGRGIAATSRDRAYTVDLGSDALLQYTVGAWSDAAKVKSPWSLFAARADDVWIAAYDGSFGHFDGRTYTQVQAPRTRQIVQILAVGADVWLVEEGHSATDTDTHVIRYADGKLTEWNQGLTQVQLSAVDATHVWMSGEPAQRWDGTTWTPLAFDAHGVWARANDAVYFTTSLGDISRWDGKRLELMHHGFVSIKAIGGSRDRGFAVGPGGLTLELGRWPDAQR